MSKEIRRVETLRQKIDELPRREQRALYRELRAGSDDSGAERSTVADSADGADDDPDDRTSDVSNETEIETLKRRITDLPPYQVNRLLRAIQYTVAGASPWEGTDDSGTDADRTELERLYERVGDVPLREVSELVRSLQASIRDESARAHRSSVAGRGDSSKAEPAVEELWAEYCAEHPEDPLCGYIRQTQGTVESNQARNQSGETNE